MCKKSVGIITLLVVLGLAQAGSAQWDPNTDPSLLGYWTFEEGTGNTVANVLGTGSDGTINGAPEWVDGRFGGGLQFDGVDDYVDTGNTEDLTTYTICCWFTSPAAPGSTSPTGPVHREQNYQINWNHGDGVFRASVAMSVGGTWHAASFGTLEGNKWYHLVGTYDGQTLKSYVNGKLITENSSPSGDPVAETNSLKFCRHAAAEQYCAGTLDEVRVYRRALTEAEIKSMVPPQLKALEPIPADGATSIIMPLLQWTKGDTAIFHNVYMGTSPDLTDADIVSRSQPFNMYYHILPLMPGQTYYWRIDEVEGDMVTTHTGDVWSFTTAPLQAYQPVPADAARYQNVDSDLVWLPGKNAVGHDVYFGTDRDAVAAGDASVFMGTVTAPLLELDPLAMETTYYWRVDENETGGTQQIGDVWSFTTTIPGLGAVKRELWLNIGAGTSVDDLLGAASYPGNPSDVNEMPTFNAGSALGDNYGGRLSAWLHVPVAGEYTFWVAGDDNTRLYLGEDQDNTELIAEVPGYSSAQAWDAGPTQKSDPIALEAGRYYIAALWKEGGGGDHCSAAWQGPGVPVRELIDGSYCKPFEALWSYGPRPRNNAVDVAHTSQLVWSPGVKATQQQIYFGDDADAVANADTTTTGIYRGQQSADNSTFDPGMLEFGKTYYWRVDESSPAEPESPWEGSVWSFTVATFVVVDDFESYVDDVIGRIFQTWIDGWGYTEPAPGDPGNGTGATVGYLDPPFAEQTIVHGGSQSMPFDFNNIIPPYYSETERTWAAPQDWTINDVDTLSLWVQGNQASPTVNETAPGALSVTGEGADIWGVTDQFTYVYKGLNGDGSLVARVVSNGEGSNTWAKGGVMIRDSLAPGSTHTMMIISAGGGNGASLQWRPDADDVSSNTDNPDAAVEPPYWVKIERSGHSITGSISPNGTTWTQMGMPQVIFMTNPVHIGLCVTSHVAGTDRTFEFDNVQAVGASGQWQATAVGLTRNDPATLYVAIQDSTGTIKAVPSTDPGLVNVTDWTEWPILLTEFGNVNLTRVKKMIIGVGNRDFPQPGGHGMLFIDDIRVVKPAPPEPEPTE